MRDIAEPQSPCIKVCELVDNICVGCYRSKDEITEWIYSDAEKRWSILQQVKERRLKCQI